MKIFYFFLGTIIPLPIFYNLLTNEFFVQKTTLNQYIFYFGVPIPLGLLAVTILGLLAFICSGASVWRQAEAKQGLVFAGAFGVLFFTFGLYHIELLRLLSLIFPWAAIVFIYIYFQSHTIYTYSMKGFMFAFSTFAVAHAVSIVLFERLGVENQLLLFTSFFGYTLYQALISYSAVLSFFGCSLIVLVCEPGKTNQRLLYLLVIVSIFFVLAYGGRKTVLADIVILFGAYFLHTMLAVLSRFKLNKSALRALFLLIGMFVLLLYFGAFLDRGLSYENAIRQRGGAYSIFWILITESTLLQLLFGHGGGWGGFSNLFVEMIVRLGLIGILLYMALFLFLIRFIGLRLLRYAMADIDNGHVDFHLKVWFTFAVLSFIFSNMINMNIQLPYYVINICFLSLLFIGKSRDMRIKKYALINHASRVQ